MCQHVQSPSHRRPFPGTFGDQSRRRLRLIKNRTSQTLARFFSFVSRYFPATNTFMCDRHFAQRRAISAVFGHDVYFFHCCVHVARVLGHLAHGHLAQIFFRVLFLRDC